MTAPQAIDVRILPLRRELRRATVMVIIAYAVLVGIGVAFSCGVAYVMTQVGIDPMWLLNGAIPGMIAVWIMVAPISRAYYRRRQHLLDTMAVIKRTITIPAPISEGPPETE